MQPLKYGNYTKEELIALEIEYGKSLRIRACRYCSDPYLVPKHNKMRVCPMCKQARKDLNNKKQNKRKRLEKRKNAVYAGWA